MSHLSAVRSLGKVLMYVIKMLVMLSQKCGAHFGTQLSPNIDLSPAISFLGGEPLRVTPPTQHYTTKNTHLVIGSQQTSLVQSCHHPRPVQANSGMGIWHGPLVLGPPLQLPPHKILTRSQCGHGSVWFDQPGAENLKKCLWATWWSRVIKQAGFVQLYQIKTQRLFKDNF